MSNANKHLTWLEIDLGAIRSNVANLKSLLKPETKFMAVVKANAYGHGLVPVAQAAVEAGAECLGVVAAEEALALRAAGVRQPIVILGVVSTAALPALAEAGIDISISSRQWLLEAEEVISSLPRPLRVHLKVETGLHRLGMEAEAATVAEQIRSHPNLELAGIYSHLAAMEELHEEFTHEQGARFANYAEQIGGVDGELIRHISASAAAMLHPELHYDMVRCGIAIYGLWPSAETQTSACASGKVPDRHFLKPALTLKTRIVQVKDVAEGTVGYGRTYHVKRPMKIAILPVGYADGYDRLLSNCGEALIGGVRCPVVGRVAMNMTAIDVSMANIIPPVPNPKIGDEVVLIGRQGDEEVTAEEIAEKIGTINYEVVARLPRHLIRCYL